MSKDAIVSSISEVARTPLSGGGWWKNQRRESRRTSVYRRQDHASVPGGHATNCRLASTGTASLEKAQVPGHGPEGRVSGCGRDIVQPRAPSHIQAGEEARNFVQHCGRPGALRLLLSGGAAAWRPADRDLNGRRQPVVGQAAQETVRKHLRPRIWALAEDPCPKAKCDSETKIGARPPDAAFGRIGSRGVLCRLPAATRQKQARSSNPKITRVKFLIYVVLRPTDLPWSSWSHCARAKRCGNREKIDGEKECPAWTEEKSCPPFAKTAKDRPPSTLLSARKIIDLIDTDATERMGKKHWLSVFEKEANRPSRPDYGQDRRAVAKGVITTPTCAPGRSGFLACASREPEKRNESSAYRLGLV